MCFENGNKCSQEQHEGGGYTTASSPEELSQESIEKEIKKLGFVVKELIDTEQSYVQDLAQVVDGCVKRGCIPKQVKANLSLSIVLGSEYNELGSFLNTERSLYS